MDWTIFAVGWSRPKPLDFNTSKQSRCLVRQVISPSVAPLDATMQQLDRIELDPAVEGELTLGTFQVGTSVLFPALAHCLPQGKFDVKDFVGSVSERLIAQSKTSSGRASDLPSRFRCMTRFSAAFDPKPFIRTFEAAVDRLIAIRKDVQTKTEQLEKSVRVSEREYSKKMAELNKGFEVCATSSFPSRGRDHTFVRVSARHFQRWRLN